MLSCERTKCKVLPLVHYDFVRTVLGGAVVEFSPPTSEAAGLNLGPALHVGKLPGGFLHL